MRRLMICTIAPLLAFMTVAWSEDRYVPFPVIFVHGIASEVERWDKTREALDDFFKDKYGYHAQEANATIDRDSEYFPFMNYEARNNGDIQEIAASDDIETDPKTGQVTFRSLKATLNDALRKYARKIGIPDSVALKDLPADKVKLNLVCHSMGGLVLRSLLKQEADGKFAPLPNDFYKSHINRVVFIGTPHNGTPFASGLWLVNEQKKQLEKRLGTTGGMLLASLTWSLTRGCRKSAEAGRLCRIKA